MAHSGNDPLRQSPSPGSSNGTLRATGYFDHPLRVGTILGSFAVLCVPLAVLQIFVVPSTAQTIAFVIYAVLLGATHFVVTLTIYFNSRNLRYFASSASNVAIYFVVPITIFSAFFVIGFFGLHEPANGSSGFLLYLFWFTFLVKGADYFHVVRQSFGILQLFKARSRHAFPTWMRSADNFFFLAMAGLQQLTFLEGMRGGSFTFTLSVPAVMLMALAGLSLTGMLAGFIVAGRAPERAGTLWVPLTYFLCQGASACLPVLRSELYGASLAMHYVEYHLIIFPRLFSVPTNPSSTVDRAFLRIRRHKFVFYVILVILACLAARDIVWPLISAELGSTRALWLLFNLFNGVFVAHYFIDAFIWKFSSPFYRASLGPLYFPSAHGGTSTDHPSAREGAPA